ncbi:helix-turn-helix domain-containing protein [Caballeronia sp. LZ035]|uniref:GlxA family transcriptional regulator n=1 Tax=Caballeronia sp. LZ035 TaxID=3038568 RepID=UPI00285FDA21|nr:helix-turn-helix domain-containing protein [Caballeronia sp. LZ035]MDR5756077.1 helix-turn-helix domain-containing protein [Caballeronia sp. LZ035]
MNITVDVIIYPGFKALEAVGALSVFKYANAHLRKRERSGAYDVKLTSMAIGPVMSETEIPLYAEKKLSSLNIPHTAVIVGAWDIEGAVNNVPDIVEWFKACASQLQRTIALCSGAFFLAQAGVLNGKRATTHWAVADMLQASYPTVELDSDCIFIQQGKVWTSAGVTAGLDLALAVVEQDFGADIALDVARDLVVFLRRQGGQSQFSAHLDCNATQNVSVRDLQNWMLEHLDQDLATPDMASRAAMSVRSFNRCFRKETGTTPTAFLMRARIEAARRMLEEGNLPAKTIAADSGFKTYDAMRKAFQTTLGITPLVYRERFGAAAESSAET